MKCDWLFGANAVFSSNINNLSIQYIEFTPLIKDYIQFNSVQTIRV